MAHWIYLNLNPLQNRTGDCVIRSFAFFFDKTWREAFDELLSWTADHGRVNFNFRSNYNEFLAEKGYKRNRAPRKGMTVAEFCEEVAQSEKTYLVSCKRHLTIIGIPKKFGPWLKTPVVVDTWDCRGKIMDGYWEKPNVG